jgi:S-adenosylmethionine:diacylglycerol 3-amino-3-carboxypropyl transferase
MSALLVGPTPTPLPVVGTPWAEGRLGRRGRPALLFGTMFEDAAVEIAAFTERERVLAVASAGDVALALAAAGHRVTAVDVNPAQIAYVGERLWGGPRRVGQADRLLALGRRVLAPAGWGRARLARLSVLDERHEQVAEWRRLTTGASGAALRALLAPAALRLGYRRPFAALAGPLGRALPARIERGLARHPNRSNPFARLLFTGQAPAPVDLDGAAARAVTLAVDDVAAHLEAAPAGSYDAFALSNVLDGAPGGYRARLLAAVRRAAAPGAVVVLRTLLPARGPRSAADAAAAERDRALIWGGLTIAPAEELR